MGVSLTAVAVVVSILLAPSDAGAAVPAPGWSLLGIAGPTNFSSADTRDQTLTMTVSATGGTYRLSLNGGESAATLTDPIAWDEPAAGIQQKLEKIEGIGAGSVTVTGGPGGSAPYRIAVGGLRSGQTLTLLVRDALLEGGEERVALETTVTGLARDRYRLVASNDGSRAAEGEVSIVDALPAGLVALNAIVLEPRSGVQEECAAGRVVRCVYSGPPVRPGDFLRVTMEVAVESAAVQGVLQDTASVTGGGAPEATATDAVGVDVGVAPFGIHRFDLFSSDVEGAADTQAGDHPYETTTTLEFTTALTGAGTYAPVREVKAVDVELPAGFVGDPFAAERCREIDLTTVEGHHATCPAGSQVGTMRVIHEGGFESANVPVYNMVPATGYPAELGFNAGIGQPTFLYASLVPSADGYRIHVFIPGALRSQLEDIIFTIFGDPGEHNGTSSTAAFLRNPTACSGKALSARAQATAWEGGEDRREAIASPQITGCGLLQGLAAFAPTMRLTPEVTTADAPSGYEVDIELAQAQGVFGVPAPADLERALVTLPAGVSLSPSVGSGPEALSGCAPGEFARLGTEPGEGHPGGNGSPYDDGMTHASPGHCPASSQIGEVEVKTPLLASALRGHLYLAQPSCGGEGQSDCSEDAVERGEAFGIDVEAAGASAIVKLEGALEVGGHGRYSRETGLAADQLRIRFADVPQLPLEEVRLMLSGGQRAPLAAPQGCGSFTTTGELEPWSAPASGPNPVRSSTFAIGSCPNASTFAPSFTAGTVSPDAGGFSPLVVRLDRRDGEQDVERFTLTMPAGLAGALSTVALCREPQAALGTCPASSQIGVVTAAIGSGSQPLWRSGPVYLTGPHGGAPFGLSVVVPARVGPMSLGNVVVRASLAVDPKTARLTLSTDPLPQDVDGVPLRLKTLDVELSRRDFIFNPTSCQAQAVTGAVTAVQGGSMPVAVPFAASGCSRLAFAPSFSASTRGRTSKQNGASLRVRVTQKPGQAHIRRIVLQLPLQLSSRLETLQQACRAAQFEANPAGCPAQSVIGTATVDTPVLESRLTGPAYLVSHGGAAFPDVEYVLQAEGMLVVLDGQTVIAHETTFSRFESMPDVPISRFETNLPQGPHSVFGANLPASADSSFCGRRLSMPTLLEGQNGVVVKRVSDVAVTGCRPTIEVLGGTLRRRRVLIELRSAVAGTVVVSGAGVVSVHERVPVGPSEIAVPLVRASGHRGRLKLTVTLRAGRHVVKRTVRL